MMTREYGKGYDEGYADGLKDAIEQAQKQEPVAWMSSGEARMIHWKSKHPSFGDDWIPLYTSPPTQSSQRPAAEGEDTCKWVGLTDEDIDQGLLRSDYAFKTAEAWRAGVVFTMTKLKEKNT